MGGTLTGQVLGQKYHLDALLGKGGFASVYRATQLDLGRTVAVKVLDKQLSQAPGFIERFKREAQATFSLRHPNIVEVYDFQGGSGRYFIAMELVEGPSLFSLLQERGAFPADDDDELTLLRAQTSGQNEATVLRQAASRYVPLEVGQAVAITCQLCDALTYAHAQGVVHRDLKPENILLTPAGAIKLSDFGIAHVQADERLTHLGTIIGTPSYMSPEQTMGAPIDARSDIYSLGIVLYELLAGTVPFAGGPHETQQVFRMHQSLPPPPLAEVCPVAAGRDGPGLPPGLDEIVQRMLAKWPAERFQTADQVRQALLTVAQPASLAGLLQGRPQTMIMQEGAGLPAPASANPAAGQVCPACGVMLGASPGEAASLLPEDEAGACPLCGEQSAPSRRMMAAERIDQEAALFVAGFQLENDLSLEVRSYEFRRAIEPELKTRTQEALDEWHAILQAGPLVTPITPSEEQPEPGRVLSAIRGLNALAMLWSSGAVGDYLVTLPSQRKARLRTAELCSRAQMLGGLLWSLRGARAASAQEARDAYQRAACLWRTAAQACAREDASWGIHPQEAAAAGLVARAAEAILRYPEDRPAAEQELRELAVPADSLPGWYTAGAPRLAELAGLYTHLQQRLSSIQQQAGQATLHSRQAGGQLKSQMQRAAWHIRQAQEDMQAVLDKTPQLPALRNIATALGLYLSGVIVIALIFNLRHDIVDLLACGLLFAAIAGAGLLILYSWVQLVRRDKESRDLYKEKLLTMDSRRVGVRQAIAEGNQAVDEFDRISLMLQERLQKLQAGLGDVRRLMSAAMLGNPLPADFADARPLEDAMSAQARQVAELRSRSVRDLEAQRRLAGSDLLARSCSGQWEPLGFAFTLPQDIELNAAITLQGEGAAERRLIALQILAEVLVGQGYTAKGLDKGIWEFRRGSRLGKFFGFDIRIFPARIQARLEIPGSQTLVIRLTGRVNARKGTALNPQRLASELAELGNRFMMGKIETSLPTPPFQGASRSPKRRGGRTQISASPSRPRSGEPTPPPTPSPKDGPP